MSKKDGFSLGFQRSQELNMSGPPKTSYELEQTLTKLSTLKDDIRKLNESLKQSQDELRKNLESNKSK